MNWLQQKVNQLPQEYTDPQYWLAGIGAGLIAVNLTLTWRGDNVEVLGNNFMFLGAAGFLIWERRDKLKLESSFLATLFGLAIVAIVLIKSSAISGYDVFLRVSPFISGIGLALIASGGQAWKQYWQELTLLIFPIISPGLLLRVFDISPITAKFATFILWYLNFPVQNNGSYIILPTGAVDVYFGCSGYSSIIQLLGLSVLFLFMFPTTKKQKIYLPILAVTVGFVVNAIRVALMAYLVAYSTQQAFEYWHKGDGSLIFSMIAVAIFGFFCWLFVLREEDKKNHHQGEE